MKYDLLTYKEAKELPLWIRACGVGWWTKTPGKFPNTMAVVFDDGQVQEFGPNPDAQDFGVRVVMYDGIGDDFYFSKGDTIVMKGIHWVYIGGGRWLTCDIIGRHSFDGVKEWIENELH